MELKYNRHIAVSAPVDITTGFFREVL